MSVLLNAKNVEHKQKREVLRFFTIPDDPGSIVEARVIYSEYVTKMRQVIEGAGKENRKCAIYGDCWAFVGSGGFCLAKQFI